MSNTSIIMRPKKWFLISNYIASVVGIVLFCYILYNVFFTESEDPAFILFILAAVSITGLLSVLIAIPNMHRFKVKLSPESITKVAVLTKEIPFEEIEQIVLRKGGVEVHGKSMFDRVAFGDLQEDFEEASKYLSQHLPNPDEIKFRGNDEYVTRFLEYRSSD